MTGFSTPNLIIEKSWIKIKDLLTRTRLFFYIQNTEANYRVQNLRQGIVMKTSFGTRVSQMGLPSFVDIDIFVLKYYFI